MDFPRFYGRENLHKRLKYNVETFFLLTFFLRCIILFYNKKKRTFSGRIYVEIYRRRTRFEF